MLLLAYIKKSRSDKIFTSLRSLGHEIEKPVIDDLHVGVEFGPKLQIKKRLSATGNNAVNSVVLKMHLATV